MHKRTRTPEQVTADTAAAVNAQADFEAVDAVAQIKLAVVAAAAADHAALVSSIQVQCTDTHLQMCVRDTYAYNHVQKHTCMHTCTCTATCEHKYALINQKTCWVM